MAKNFTELATAVQAELGKASDDVRITLSRCGDWVNRGQRKIAKMYPHLRDCYVLDKTSYVATEDGYELDLSDLTTYPLNHVLGLRYVQTNKTLTGVPSGTFTVGEVVSQATSLATGTVVSIAAAYIVIKVTTGNFAADYEVTGATSAKTITPSAVSDVTGAGVTAYKFKPYRGGLERWDADMPYIPSSNGGYPKYYQRRGNDTIEVNKPFSSVAAGAELWLAYAQIPYWMQSASTVGASATGAIRSSNVVTITTTAAHGFGVGDKVDISVTTVIGVTSFDGEVAVVSVPSSTTFTYAQTADDDTGGAGTATHIPLLTDLDECLIAWGKAMGLRAMGPKFQSAAMAEEAMAREMTRDEVYGGGDIETSEISPNGGP